MGNEIIELENGFTRKKSAIGSEISTARTKMGASELKAFYQVSTLIDKDDDKFMKYTIGVKDFITSLGFSQTDIQKTKNVCRALAKQTFEIENPINGNWEIYTIFSSFKFDNKAQTITISFNDEMRPYLLNLKQFTKIESVSYIKQFKKKYAIRLYALLKDYRKMTYRDIDIEALKKIFYLERKRNGDKKGEEKKPKRGYDDYCNFKNRILFPAVKEINEKSDLYISKIEEIKKERRKVLKIRIHFGNKSEQIANDKIDFLLKFFHKNRGDFAFKAFYGMYYIDPQSPQKTIKDLKKITSIEVDRESMYFKLFCNKEEHATLGVSGERFFLRHLCMGIYEAILIYYENDKKNRLDFGDWQIEKDKKKAQEQQIEEYKEILREWIGKKEEIRETQ